MIIWDNIHKHRWIRGLLCRIGRHDFETDSVDPNGKWARLECFYCEKRKVSYVISR